MQAEGSSSSQICWFVEQPKARKLVHKLELEGVLDELFRTRPDVEVIALLKGTARRQRVFLHKAQGGVVP